MFLKVLKGIWTYLSMALILVFFVGVASIFKTTLNLKLDEQMNKNNTRIERTFNIGSIKCSIDMTYYGVIKDTSGIGDAIKKAMIEVLKEKQQ